LGEDDGRYSLLISIRLDKDLGENSFLVKEFFRTKTQSLIKSNPKMKYLMTIPKLIYAPKYISQFIEIIEGYIKDQYLQSLYKKASSQKSSMIFSLNQDFKKKI